MGAAALAIASPRYLVQTAGLLAAAVLLCVLSTGGYRQHVGSDR